MTGDDMLNRTGLFSTTVFRRKSTTSQFIESLEVEIFQFRSLLVQPDPPDKIL